LISVATAITEVVVVAVTAVGKWQLLVNCELDCRLSKLLILGIYVQERSPYWKLRVIIAAIIVVEVIVVAAIVVVVEVIIAAVIEGDFHLILSKKQRLEQTEQKYEFSKFTLK